MRSVGVSDEATDQFLSSSPHLMKEKMKSNAANMKVIFAEVGPFFVQEGILRCEIDHKSITKETIDEEKNGFGVIAVLQYDDIHERYMMAFIPTSSTNTETNQALLDNCFKVFIESYVTIINFL